MLQVHAPSDCGNAPKKLILKEFKVAFYQGDTETVLNMVRDDVEWELVGSGRLRGKEGVRRLVEKAIEDKPVKLHIHHVITHGNQAALHGRVTMGNGEEYGFCDIYVFGSFGKNALIREVVSYLVRL